MECENIRGEVSPSIFMPLPQLRAVILVVPYLSLGPKPITQKGTIAFKEYLDDCRGGPLSNGLLNVGEGNGAQFGSPVPHTRAMLILQPAVAARKSYLGLVTAT